MPMLQNEVNIQHPITMRSASLYVFMAVNCYYWRMAECSEAVTFGMAVFLEERNSQLEIPIRNAIWQNWYKDRMQFDVNVSYVRAKDCYENAKILCNRLQNQSPVAILAPETSIAPLFQSVLANSTIPYIQTNWRTYSSFKGGDTSLNYYPEPDLVSQALAAILKSLNWKSFVILYETTEGLMRLQEIIKAQNGDKTRHDYVMVKKLAPGEDHRTVLKEVKNMKEKQIVLDCEAENLAGILQEASDVKMLEYYHDYFITSFDANSVDLSFLETRANITTISIVNHDDEQVAGVVQDWEVNEYRNGKPIALKPVMIKTETALVHDALTSLSGVLNEATIQIPAVSCGGDGKFEQGRQIVEAVKATTSLYPLTGPAEFDEMGRRINFSVYVRDWSSQSLIAVWTAKDPENVEVLRTADENLDAYFSRIKDKVFRVSSRFQEPYFMMKTPQENEVLTGNDQFEGYAFDLMNEIGQIINYTFIFVPTSGNGYGNYDSETDEWNGILGDIINYRASFGIGDLTITPERKQVVDFSLPFMRLGIGLVMKDLDAKDKTFAFLEPLTKEVWFYSATVYLTVSIVLWFVARLAPGDWENPDPRNDKPPELENVWHIKNCLWIMLGTITNQGSDIYPKGISSRMAASAWWLFALIITNSYIANLASFLTTGMATEITNIEQLAQQSKIKYGVYEHGATHSSFLDTPYRPYQKLYSNMLLARPSVFVNSLEAGIKRVQHTKNGEYAFFMESTQIEYIVATQCDLKTVGSWLFPKVFGIAMQQDSPHRKDVNYAILELEARGRFNTLKNKWWKEKRKEPLCVTKKKKGAEMAFSDIGGVFLVLATGCSMALGFGIIDFLWNIRNICVEQHVPVFEALKREILSCLKFWMNEKRIKPITEAAASSDSEATTQAPPQIVIDAHASVEQEPNASEE